MIRYPQIKRYRLDARYKQEYVAYTLQISQPQYSKLENGQRLPSTEEILRLAQLYNVTTDELLLHEAKIDYVNRKSRFRSNNNSAVEFEHLLEENERLYKVLVDYVQRSEQMLKRISDVIDRNPLEQAS